MFEDAFDSDDNTGAGVCSDSVELVVVLPVFDGVASFVGSEAVFGLWRSELIGVQRDDKSEEVDFDVSGFESEDGFASGCAFAVSEVGAAGCPFSGVAAGDCSCSAVMPVSMLILTRDFGRRTQEGGSMQI